MRHRYADRALRVWLSFALSAMSAAATPAPALSQAKDARPTPATVGVLLVAHGADPGWNSRIDSLAGALRVSGDVRGPIAVSFLMGPAAATSRFQDAIDSLIRDGARQIVIVPLLVSSHSGHYEQIRYLAGATDSLDAEMMDHLQMSGIARSRG